MQKPMQIPMQNTHATYIYRKLHGWVCKVILSGGTPMQSR